MANVSTFACVRCAARKVRCNRVSPCSACVKHGAECLYQPPRPPRRGRRQAAVVQPSTGTREQALDHNANSSSGLSNTNRRCNPSSPTTVCSPLSSQPEPCGIVNKTQVIQGQGQSILINNGLWSRVAEELGNSEDTLLEDSEYSSDIEYRDEAASGFVFGHLATSSYTKLSHPPPQQIHKLWNIFVENIDPLCKIVHVPSLESEFHKAMGDTGAVSRGFEALMFAIYSAAVMSLSDTECEDILNEPRKAFRAKLTAATRAALSHANFIATSSLIVLQALIIYIISTQDMHEPRALWTLTGVAVRIANCMGLDRDGTFDSLPPFETELRRRIWWLLKAQDQRSAELCGLPKFRNVSLSRDSTKCPTNVNDIDLCPEMPALPPNSAEPLTDMTFLAIRYDLLQFAATRLANFRHLGKDINKWDDDLASKREKTETQTETETEQIEQHLETRYLRHCDPSQPLQLMSMLMARAAIDTIRFMTHHPRRWSSIDQIPPFERQWIWKVSIRLLEQRNMLQSNPLLKKFAWHAAFAMQWPAFIHVLDTLRANPSISDARKAWTLVEKTFEYNPSLLTDGKKIIHRAVISLCLKAYDTWMMLQDGYDQSCPTAAFISRLRKQQETMNSKRQRKLAKSKGIYHSDSISSKLPPRVVSRFQHGTPPGSQAAKTVCEVNSYDEYRLTDAINNDTASGVDILTLTTDFLPVGDIEAAANWTDECINWKQWDLFLAESNM